MAAGVGPTRGVTPFTPRSPGGTAAGTSRFAPGVIIAGRYRLVALLGRGGMGEVYRADDLTLDQPVALKFLPEGVADEPSRLTQFHNELRIARQVSHKNVCRLYDLGEADGRRFLTMEFVDGENLASLLRRIGRFPEDRAIAIARQLCAGVAAAHERGVIHRDLKPANVMVDGEGNVRITDFGIATAAANADAQVVGTPQYMAPEQLTGTKASIRTDIYALGLILFETFTGRRVYEATSIGDLKSLHDTGTVTTPSSIVRDLDPAVERVILRCLDRDPARRPASALAIAAALPGGDPLAAALAAGETPSPDVLAAAGETESLPVSRGLTMLAAIVFAMIAIVALASRTSVAGRVPMDKPPAVLTYRAQEILRSLGYTDPIADSASSFSMTFDYMRWIVEHDQTPYRWNALASGVPPTLLFWYRTSPRLMMPGRVQLRVSQADPPSTVSGMTTVVVDTEGRLQEFHAVPPQFDSSDGAAPPPRWDALFEAAGLPFADFTPVAAQWSPRDFADARAAWEGPLPGRSEFKVRVEAAAYRGLPVSFMVVGPWTRPTRMQPLTQSTVQAVFVAVGELILVALVVGALLLARVNFRLKRADVRGASRIAIFVLTGYVLTWVLGAHHVPDTGQEIDSFSKAIGASLLNAGLLWIVYVALEPYVRRFWPDGLLGWTRLTSGFVVDARVGRNILIGCLFAVGLTLVELAFDIVPPWLGVPTPMPRIQSNMQTFSGLAALLASVFDYVVRDLFVAMFAVLGFVLLRLLFRRTSLAIAAAGVVLALLQLNDVVSSGTISWLAVSFQAFIVLVVILLVVRYGLLATAVGLFIGNLLDGVPLTIHFASWAGTNSIVVLFVVLGLAAFGFYASRAGQPLLGTFGTFGKLEA
jgi:serine/threonine-protein kinase